MRGNLSVESIEVVRLIVMALCMFPLSFDCNAAETLIIYLVSGCNGDDG